MCDGNFIIFLWASVPLSKKWVLRLNESSWTYSCILILQCLAPWRHKEKVLLFLSLLGYEHICTIPLPPAGWIKTWAAPIIGISSFSHCWVCIKEPEDLLLSPCEAGPWAWQCDCQHNLLTWGLLPSNPVGLVHIHGRIWSLVIWNK